MDLGLRHFVKFVAFFRELPFSRSFIPYSSLLFHHSYFGSSKLSFVRKKSFIIYITRDFMIEREENLKNGLTNFELIYMYERI